MKPPDGKQSFGGWGQRFGGSSRSVGVSSYGSSGPVRVERRDRAVPVRPSGPVKRADPVLISRPQAVQKRVPDAEFEPTPVLQLKAGQRIEHNRFGFGKILEITGSATDLKAKIVFDDHGEKLLLLKYAKIRIV